MDILDSGVGKLGAAAVCHALIGELASIDGAEIAPALVGLFRPGFVFRGDQKMRRRIEIELDDAEGSEPVHCIGFFAVDFLFTQILRLNFSGHGLLIESPSAEETDAALKFAESFRWNVPRALRALDPCGLAVGDLA